jgi:N-methylhydantoinase B
MSVDPITYEIIKNKLWAINQEAASTLRLVSGSPVANEANDMNTALMTADGDALAIGLYITIHAMSLSFTAKTIVTDYAENPGIGEDDVFLCNDPYVGPCHQMDVTAVAPIHWNGRLVAWTGATVHQIDLGGPMMGQVQVGATSIFGEQPIMPPMKIVEGGRLRKDVERLYLRRTRLEKLTALDLRAKIAACNVAKRRVHEILARYGEAAFLATVQKISADTEAVTRAKLRKIPDGIWRHRCYIDYEDRYYRVQVELTKRGDGMTLDFTESSPQAPAVINGCYPSLAGGVVAALLPLLLWDHFWCPAGLMRCVEIRSKPGTVVHAEWPAGVCKSTTTASYSVTKAVSVVVGKMLAASDAFRDQAMATWMGGLVIEELSGTDQRDRFFGAVMLDMMAEGAGARSTKDGVDTSGILDNSNFIIANVEDYEFAYPILYLYRRQEPDTGGAGRWRGGVSLSCAYLAHNTPAIPTKITHAIGFAHPESVGFFGGHPSGSNVVRIQRGSRVRELLAAGRLHQEPEEVGGTTELFDQIRQTHLGPDDVYYAVGMGGGGYGDPLEREPERVAADVRRGLVTARGARLLYGVVLTPSGSVDIEATEDLRRELRAERLQAAIRARAAV